MKLKLIKWSITAIAIFVISTGIIIFNKSKYNEENVKIESNRDSIEERRWWKCYGEMSIYYRQTGEHFSDRSKTINKKNQYCAVYAKDETFHYPGKKETSIFDNATKGN